MKKNRIIWFLFFIVLSSCTTIQSPPFPAENIIRVAAVGDSITFGKYIADRHINSYPAQLGNKLGSRWAVRNYGVSGATLLNKGNKPYRETESLLEAYEFQPDIVIIMLGTNDSKAVNWQFKDQFVSDYIDLIRSFRKLQSSPDIFICYPVPAFPGRLGIRNSVIKNEIIPLIDSIAGMMEIPLIDLYTALHDKKNMFPDTIHPDIHGAEVIAETIYRIIR